MTIEVDVAVEGSLWIESGSRPFGFREYFERVPY